MRRLEALHATRLCEDHPSISRHFALSHLALISAVAESLKGRCVWC